MLANTLPQSRFAAFVERWDSRLTRFRQVFDPSTPAPDRATKIWAIALVSIGVALLGGLITFGVIWMTDHHRWALIIPLLKVGKFVALGIGIVGAMLFRDKFSGKSSAAEAQNGGTAPTKE